MTKKRIIDFFSSFAKRYVNRRYTLYPTIIWNLYIMHTACLSHLCDRFFLRSLIACIVLRMHIELLAKWIFLVVVVLVVVVGVVVAVVAGSLSFWVYTLCKLCRYFPYEMWPNEKGFRLVSVMPKSMKSMLKTLSLPLSLSLTLPHLLIPLHLANTRTLLALFQYFSSFFLHCSFITSALLKALNKECAIL